MILAGLAFVTLAAVGTLLRAEVGWAANLPGRWPWGTLAINVVAAWGLGLVVGAAGTDSAAWSGVTVAIAAGGLGALGTVSGLAAEVVGLADGGRRPLAVAYLGVSLVAGTTAAAIGVAVAG